MSYSAQATTLDGGFKTALHQLRLTASLVWRFWPQLAALWLLGFIGNLLLNEFAAMIGRWSSLAGLSVLALVVLLKLVVIMALFETVRRGLPALNAASHGLTDRLETTTEVETPPPPGDFVSALALSLVPFFAFYTAWGFLADTVRDYSKLSLSLFLGRRKRRFAGCFPRQVADHPCHCRLGGETVRKNHAQAFAGADLADPHRGLRSQLGVYRSVRPVGVAG
ncbi:hypothetical protein [Rhizobium sp. AN80A]|uniref:hypothetical protein n=1 Tax=Rhizobium sp. AN80A TaxID=3040673 RepID=UPI0024B33806|nr:hypothetical protein [Rhizobium sp. AN80A]